MRLLAHKWIFCAFAAMVLATPTFAAPIKYDLVLTTDEVLTLPAGGPSDASYQIGDTYFGHFIVDDAILAVDGLDKLGILAEFVITIEDYTWDMNLPNPLSDFEGFRGPGPFPNSISPGFDVVGGEIVNLRGGVFGNLDFPFIDFSDPIPANRFSSLMLGFQRPEGFIKGSLLVARAVPEPGTIALLVGGLAGLVFRRHKRTQ